MLIYHQKNELSDIPIKKKVINNSNKNNKSILKTKK